MARGPSDWLRCLRVKEFGRPERTGKTRTPNGAPVAMEDTYIYICPRAETSSLCIMYWPFLRLLQKRLQTLYIYIYSAYPGAVGMLQTHIYIYMYIRRISRRSRSTKTYIYIYIYIYGAYLGAVTRNASSNDFSHVFRRDCGRFQADG